MELPPTKLKEIKLKKCEKSSQIILNSGKYIDKYIYFHFLILNASRRIMSIKTIDKTLHLLIHSVFFSIKESLMEVSELGTIDGQINCQLLSI